MDEEPADEQEDNEPASTPPQNIAPMAMGFEASLAVAAILLGVVFRHSPTASLQLEAERACTHWQACGWGVAATIPLVLAFIATRRWPIGPLLDLKQVVETRVVPLFAEATVLQLVLVAFAAGVGEEMLFRGLFQDVLVQRLSQAEPDADPSFSVVASAIVISAIFFGICHSINAAYFWLATILGALLGLLYVLTGNLLAPIVTHVLYDAIVLIWLVKRRADSVGASGASTT